MEPCPEAGGLGGAAWDRRPRRLGWAGESFEHYISQPIDPMLCHCTLVTPLPLSLSLPLSLRIHKHALLTYKASQVCLSRFFLFFCPLIFARCSARFASL